MADITIPEGARGLLLTRNGTDTTITPVPHGASVLNIRRDLLTHLNETPHSTEWLEILRDYCDARIKARAQAHEAGAIVTPSHRFEWDMTAIERARGAA